MKIQIITIGKKDEPKYVDAISDFTTRARHYLDTEWKIVSGAKDVTAPTEKQKQEEGEKILKILSDDDFVILLDEKGNNISTPVFAELLQKHLNRSTKNLTFIIGGAYGVSQEVLKRANFTWSLSKLVFPHGLARLILIEQIYRAGTILKAEKYHHQ